MFNAKALERRRGAAAVAASAVLVGCASMAPGGLPPGTPIAKARQSVFGPTGEYRLPDGGTRLEFAQGSFGKQTYMLDFDRAGLLVSSRQVLTEENFATIRPGMSEHDVLMRLGRPAEVFGVPWQKLHVLNYRFFGGDCVWFQVSVKDVDRQVTESNIGSDPSCDGPNDRD